MFLCFYFFNENLGVAKNTINFINLNFLEQSLKSTSFLIVQQFWLFLTKLCLQHNKSLQWLVVMGQRRERSHFCLHSILYKLPFSSFSLQIRPFQMPLYTIYQITSTWRILRHLKLRMPQNQLTFPVPSLSHCCKSETWDSSSSPLFPLCYIESVTKSS